MDKEFQRLETGYPDSAGSFVLFHGVFITLAALACISASIDLYVMSPLCMPPFVEIKPAPGNLLYRHTAPTPAPFVAAYPD